MQRLLEAVAIAALLLGSATGCEEGPACGERGGSERRGMMEGRGMMQERGMMSMSRVRHRYVMRHGIDPRYASEESPLAPTSEDVRDGRELYEQHCARCHGPTGRGDGPAGEGLEPPPANIAAFSRMPMATDAYLYWTIAEGGAPVGSAMPPFGGTLEDEEIWKIITFLRRM